MCQPDTYMYYTYIYIHTRHWCMLKRDRSWSLFQLSVSCLPSPGYPTARIFQPKIHHVCIPFPPTPANAFIPTRPMQSRRPVWPTWRRFNPLIDLPKHPRSIRWLLSDSCPTSIELHSCGDCVTTLPLVCRNSLRQKILMCRIIN